MYGWPTTVVLTQPNEDIDRKCLEINTVLTVYKFHFSLVQFTVQQFCHEIPLIVEGEGMIMTTDQIISHGDAIKSILSHGDAIKQADAAINSAYKKLYNNFKSGNVEIKPFKNLGEAIKCCCQYFTTIKLNGEVALLKRKSKINIMSQGNKN